MKFKKNFLGIILIFYGLNSGLAQRNYYVSASGSDSNNGTSTSSPWKTIAKVNSNKGSFVAGDVINFNRGDVFYGSLDLKGRSGNSGSPIVVKSYGSGKQAVIRAARKLNNWTRHNGNIWKTNLGKIDNARTSSLFLENVAQQIGREPNFNITDGGYRTIGSHTSNNRSISESSNLPYVANRFRGGEITIRTTDDNVKVETITSHSGKTVNFNLSRPNDSFENRIEDNFGYFFQNHVNTLDKNGEWAHDINAGILYLYTTTNPNNLSVEIPSGENAININNGKYFRIQNLRFEGGLSQTLLMSGASNITITGCYLYNGNQYLTLGYTLTNINFSNNVLDQSNNLGLRWENISGVTFSNNKVRNIGMRSGMGARSFIGYSGIRFYGRSGGLPNIIEKNTLEGIGYHALQFGGDNFKIRYNDISNYCFTKDDGGGIYTVGNRESNNSIYKNIVHDSPGAIRGIPSNRGVKTAGIYIDNDSQNQLIYENTIYNVVGWGLMANLSSKSTIRDNTVYNCEMGIVLSTYNNSFGAGGSVAQATRNTVLRNTFFTRKPSQFCARYTNQITDAGFNTFLGDINSNYYCQPFTGGKELSIRAGRQTSEYLLPQFKSKYPNYEKKGKNAPVKFNASVDPNTIMRFEVNKTNSEKQINLGNTNYVDAKNISYSGNVTLAPYSSIVLLKGEGEIQPPPSAQLITNGAYTIESITSNQRLLSRAKENYETRMVNPGEYDDQKWIFNHLGDNIYTIKNRANSRYLEVPNAKCENSVQVSTFTQILGDHQKWRIIKNGEGIYGLNPAHCLAQGLDRNNGMLNTNVITYSFGMNNGNQKWKIIPTNLANRKGENDEALTQKMNNFSVYPNPAKEFMKIEGLSLGDKIKIYDMQGKMMMNMNVTDSEEVVSLKSLKSGLYIVSISDTEKIQFIKE
ncbi:right-handed parallel beta-helix repeat-containing protein [Aquimarina algiphila]|uniref:right-handed parallel beta-helix repeat-containing protein n=1 Tax=Aquimarina algiphila TaxID=2047982 RepID=UPI002491EF83|nr:right-handed parallel beta-helix repeat-containing protein [Aquimarina algiphila]